MWKWIKAGWTMTWHQPFTVCVLFIYNLAWGLTLYSLIRSVVVPLLHRYPGNELSHQTVQLFWVESQFRIMKTDLIHPYMEWGLGLLLLRMLLTPLLNAGIYYSLEHTEMNSGYRFVQGMRKLGLSYLGLYAVQMLLSLSPLYLLAPKIAASYGKHTSLTDLVWDVLPIIALYLLYLFALQVAFMYLQFARLNGAPPRITLWVLVRHALPIIALACLLLLPVVFVSAAVLGSSMIWAGFAALAGVQAYRLIHMFFKVWAVASQYALWKSKLD